jgi:hypothetical protein
MLEALHKCLLDDRELAMGPEKWVEFPDPFPRWIARAAEPAHEHAP